MCFSAVNQNFASCKYFNAWRNAPASLASPGIKSKTNLEEVYDRLRKLYNLMADMIHNEIKSPSLLGVKKYVSSSILDQRLMQRDAVDDVKVTHIELFMDLLGLGTFDANNMRFVPKNDISSETSANKSGAYSTIVINGKTETLSLGLLSHWVKPYIEKLAGGDIEEKDFDAKLEMEEGMYLYLHLYLYLYLYFNVHLYLYSVVLTCMYIL